MMDMALEAGTRAISEEAAENRRLTAESQLATRELRLVEEAWAAAAAGRAVATSAATAAAVKARFEQPAPSLQSALW